MEKQKRVTFEFDSNTWKRILINIREEEVVSSSVKRIYAKTCQGRANVPSK